MTRETQQPGCCGAAGLLFSREPDEKIRISLTVPFLLLIVGWGAAVLSVTWSNRPRSLRERFETVQLGMTEDHVKELLGPVDNVSHPFESVPTHAVQLVKRDGRVERLKYSVPLWKVYLAVPGPPGSYTRYDAWVTRNAAVYVYYDSQRHVDEAWWIEERPYYIEWQLWRLEWWLKGRFR